MDWHAGADGKHGECRLHQEALFPLIATQADAAFIQPSTLENRLFEGEMENHVECLDAASSAIGSSGKEYSVHVMQRSTTPPAGAKRLNTQSSDEQLSCAMSQSCAILQPRFYDIQLSLKSDKGNDLQTLEELCGYCTWDFWYQLQCMLAWRVTAAARPHELDMWSDMFWTNLSSIFG